MCTAVSPERTLIWAVLRSAEHWQALSSELRAEHFTHPPYRRWFEICARRHAAGKPPSAAEIEAECTASGHPLGEPERRALRRMLRDAPPARLVDNLPLLARALADRAEGRRVDLERIRN